MTKKKNDYCGGTHFRVVNTKNAKKIKEYLDDEWIYNIDSVYSSNKLDIFIIINNDVMVSSNIFPDTNIPKIKRIYKNR